MFIGFKSVLYPTCAGPPSTLTSLFTVISIIRSPCFVENLSPVRLPPKPFSLRFSRLMCLIHVELPIMYVNMSDNDCNLDDQMQKAVTAALFLPLNASQYYIP